MKTKARTLSAAEFKANCLSIFVHMDSNGIRVEKRGKPVAKVMPIKDDDFELFGCLKGSMKINGEIMSTGIKWDAES